MIDERKWISYQMIGLSCMCYSCQFSCLPFSSAQQKETYNFCRILRVNTVNCCNCKHLENIPNISETLSVLVFIAIVQTQFCCVGFQKKKKRKKKLTGNWHVSTGCSKLCSSYGGGRSKIKKRLREKTIPANVIL